MPPEEPHRKGSFTLVILAAYAGLGIVALVWSMLRNDGTCLWDPRPGATMEPGLAALIGAVSGLLVACLSQLAVTKFTFARRLEEEFASILGPLSVAQVIGVAIFSSVAEEAFFRGAMQPDLGLVLTSLIFGLLHVGPGKVFLPWTVMALGMGFALGGLFIWTGSLLAPILCHGMINTINLRRIALRAQLMEEASRTT